MDNRRIIKDAITTASMIGDCTLEKGMMADGSDLAAWKWLVAAVDTEKGDWGAPSVYKRDIEIAHIDRVGNPIQTWILKGAFCKKIEWSDNEGGSDEHSVETLTLSVDDVKVA